MMRLTAKEKEKLTRFLETGRTVPEIKSVLPRLDSPDKLRGVQLLDGYALFEQKNDLDLPVFRAVPEEVGRSHKPRAWKLWRHQGIHPYLWIQFPHELPFGEIKIVPLSDVHYGARAHSKDRFRRYIEWIAKNDNVFAFLNGDIIENAIDGSVGGAVYESILTPNEQLFGSRTVPDEPGIIELLRPIAHKLLWAQPGNHEWRTWKKTNIDPLEIICRILDIPYFSEPIFADILAWGHRFTFYCHHGVSGSRTKGGKMNAARRPAGFQDPVCFVIMGHVHDSMANVESVLVRERRWDDEGNILSHRLVEKSRYTVICPSFHGFFDSYGSRAGYSPGSWGSVSCILYKDGNYRSSE